MAIDANSYFSNSIPGAMNIAGEVDLFQIDSTPKLAVGTKMDRQDGNVYRYCHVGSATAAGSVVAIDLNSAARAYSANCLIAPSSTFQQDTELNGVYPGALGSRYIACVIAAPAADYYAGGYITISSGTGLGYTYRIKGNQAASGTATVLELYSKVKVAIDATGDVSIAPCKYQVIGALAANTRNAIPVGVLVSAVTGTSNWAWVLTKGLIGVQQSGAIVTGTYASLSDTDIGCVEAFGNGAAANSTGSGLIPFLNIPIVGQCVLTGATSGHAIINVALE
jgi:hypothetical protein